MNKKNLFILTAAAIAAIILGVAVGSVFINPSDIISVLLNKIFQKPFPYGFNEANISIIWELRLPRVLLAFLVGAALSVGGAVVQSVLKNPLASPFTLGVSSGASLGAGIIIITGISLPLLGAFTLPLFGLLFGMLTVFLAVMLAAKTDKMLSGSTIVLTGMVFSVFTNALLTFIAGLSGDKYQAVMKWQLGTFSAKGWDYVKIMFPIFVICLLVILFFSRELDILSFGEETAAAIGVQTKKTKWLLLMATAILTGAAVSFAGVIGFIDLIAPHIARRLFSPRHKILVPMSALFGGIFMVAADLIARTAAAPKEFSVNVIAALAGAPFFAYVYLRRKQK
jgi:iron complex transport system permease protein